MVNPLNVSGLFEGGKADYLFGSAFLCVMKVSMKKCCVGFKKFCSS